MSNEDQLSQCLTIGLKAIHTAIVQREKQQKALLQRVVNTLDWMVEDIKMRFDQTGIGGHYSPELTEAMNLLKELNVSVIRACKDTNELRTVVAKQMETQAEITQNGNT